MNLNIFGGGIAGTKNEFFVTKCRKIVWLLCSVRRQNNIFGGGIAGTKCRKIRKKCTMWDSNPRNTKYQILSLTPLTARETVLMFWFFIPKNPKKIR